MAPKKEIPRATTMDRMEKHFKEQGKPQWLGHDLHVIVNDMINERVGEAKKEVIENLFGPSSPAYKQKQMDDAVNLLAEKLDKAIPMDMPPRIADHVMALSHLLEAMARGIRPHDQELLNAVRTWNRKELSYEVKGGLHMYGGVRENVMDQGTIDLGDIDKPADCICIVLDLEHPDEFISGGDWEKLANELEEYGDIHSAEFMAPRKVKLT